ncbi:MAG: hypothetical protein AB7F95_16000, partial [Burkholderiales bacterium]
LREQVAASCSAIDRRGLMSRRNSMQLFFAVREKIHARSVVFEISFRYDSLSPAQRVRSFRGEQCRQSSRKRTL